MAGLAACAGKLPVPGGDDRMNSELYSHPDDFINRVNQLRPGMSHPQVFELLQVGPERMTKLSRTEIMGALYGSHSASFDGSLAEQERGRAFLQTLYGYRFEYVDVERDHGFASPIRVRTHENGYRYNLLMVFRNGYLFDKPVLSGGIVKDSSSRTLFDYLNPLGLINGRILE